MWFPIFVRRKIKANHEWRGRAALAAWGVWCARFADAASACVLLQGASEYCACRLSRCMMRMHTCMYNMHTQQLQRTHQPLMGIEPMTIRLRSACSAS